jgi:polyisoprenoid-binding protein YceI
LKTSQSAAAIAALVLGLAGAAAAAPTPPAQVQAGTYAVEPTHTRVVFAVDHFGTSTWYGDFSKASGTLTLDPKNPGAASVSVEVPVATVSTTNSVLDGELKAADWLDAAKCPNMSFKSTKVTPTGPDRATIAGELTIHCVTKPVTLQAHYHGAGVNPLTKAYTVGFDATGKITRSEFGVTKYVPMVSDEVQIILSAPFVKKAG